MQGHLPEGNDFHHVDHRKITCKVIYQKEMIFIKVQQKKIVAENEKCR
jgi:hypothetical protein